MAGSFIPTRGDAYASPRPPLVFDSRVEKNKTAHKGPFRFLCPREESNLDYEIRNLAFYPLNYEGLLQPELFQDNIKKRWFVFPFLKMFSDKCFHGF